MLKNYLFMRLGDRAEAVYESIWTPLEKTLAPNELELLFWLDLLTIDEKAARGDTYIGQQRRCDQLPDARDIECEVRRLARLGQLLALMLHPEQEADPGVRFRLARLKAWDTTVANALVLQLLRMRDEHIITSTEVAASLLVLESYFVRRVVSGQATNGLNRALIGALSAVLDSSTPHEALRDYLSGKRRYFATDADISEIAVHAPFYWQGRTPQRALILRWLDESYLPKETVSLANGPGAHTIEHILPQKMSAAVRAEFALGLDANADPELEHQRVVHTLGNLILSGYNSELSNLPFSVKRTRLAESAFAMNKLVASHERWSVPEIEARSRELADQIIHLWPGPNESIAAEPVASDFSRRMSQALSVIPAGRWTSYTDVATAIGSHPAAVGTAISSVPLPHAWRVLQANGEISPLFRWPDPACEDDPRQLLLAEGVSFDGNRADRGQHLAAAELATLAGMEVDVESISEAGVGRRLRSQRKAFWTLVREIGVAATQDFFFQKPSADNWYETVISLTGARVVMRVNTRTSMVSTLLYIASDKALFDELLAERDSIERQLGHLDWRALPDKKASTIEITHPGDFRDPEVAPDLAEWLVKTTVEFHRVFTPLLHDILAQRRT